MMTTTGAPEDIIRQVTLKGGALDSFIGGLVFLRKAQGVLAALVKYLKTQGDILFHRSARSPNCFFFVLFFLYCNIVYTKYFSYLFGKD